MTAPDDDCPAVAGKLRKASKSWYRLPRTLGREGVSPRVTGFFFMSGVLVVLLLGLEMWLMNPCMGMDLGGVQHRAA